MPMPVSCIHNGGHLGIDEALELRDSLPESARPKFKCEVCGEPVRAHKQCTDGAAAHFEHFKRNWACPRSGPPK